MDNGIKNVRLISLQEIPEKYRSLFAPYPCLNRVQSTVFSDIIQSDLSLVITAPTGSGKTVVFELAILKLMMDYDDLKSLKIVYVAPVKALCNERFNDWKPRFEAFNMSVIEVTGDSIDHCDLQDHQIIITTPEKWDSLTRRWRDNVSLVQMVKLVMIDEVHLLSDNKRGPILETIVCRMKTVMRVLKLQNSLRFIAVSATIFNIEDLAKWFGTTENNYKFYRFGQEVRPVTLNRVVKGYPLNKSPYLFDIQLSYKLKSILVEYGDGKPTLIFCSTRRGVVQTCKTLMENISFNFSQQQNLVLKEISDKIVDLKLKEFIRHGGAYHHAGMAFEDRLLVQNAFADGILPVLVATTTLAMGVNLPAHLVIIKSTHQYIAGRIVEYSESSVLQMVGRAGRPQFDTTATAVIMTKTQMVHKYQNLLDCKEVIESSLHLHLPEQLNAEIVLLTIFDLSVAMQWIQCTFFYLRALKNPQYYGLSGNSYKIEKDLELMVLRAINALKRSQLIEMNENGLDITPTINGRLMSHYYINFNTFQLFFQITEFATVKDLIEILSNANELTEIQLRVNDRRQLNELNVNKNTETIRFRLNGKIKTRELKINCLLQACLGCLPMDTNLQQESTRIINVLERIVKCLTEFLTRKNAYCSLLSSVILSKCLHAKLWENSSFVARQFDRIGATLGATLVAFGKTSFNTLLESHPHELESIVNRGPPFGNLITEQVRHLPMYSLFVQVDRKSVLNYTIQIKISIINKDLLLIHNTAGHNHSFVLIVGDTNNRLVTYKRIFDENILNDDFEVAIEINPPMPQKVFIHVISEQWVGIDLVKDVLINPLAAIVVGSNCYLPNVENNPKKTKVVEEKKGKEVGIVKKKIKPVVNQNVPKIAPNFINLNNVCCFDLEPDWIANSPEMVESNGYNNKENLELIGANDFATNNYFEVPDISSPIRPYSIDSKGLYKPDSNSLNYCQDTTHRNFNVSFPNIELSNKIDKKIPQIERNISNIGSKSIVDNIRTVLPAIDESISNILCNKPLSLDNSENLPDDISDFKIGSSHQVDKSPRHDFDPSLWSNQSNNKMLVDSIPDIESVADNHVFNQQKSILYNNSKNCDFSTKSCKIDNLCNFETSNILHGNDLPYNYVSRRNIELNYNKNSLTDKVRDGQIDNPARYQPKPTLSGDIEFGNFGFKPTKIAKPYIESNYNEKSSIDHVRDNQNGQIDYHAPTSSSDIKFGNFGFNSTKIANVCNVETSNIRSGHNSPYNVSGPNIESNLNEKSSTDHVRDIQTGQIDNPARYQPKPTLSCDIEFGNFGFKPTKIAKPYIESNYNEKSSIDHVRDNQNGQIDYHAPTSSSDIKFGNFGFKSTKIANVCNVETSNIRSGHNSPYNVSGPNIESNFNEKSSTDHVRDIQTGQIDNPARCQPDPTLSSHIEFGNFGLKPPKIANLCNVETSNILLCNNSPYNYVSGSKIKSNYNEKSSTDKVRGGQIDNPARCQTDPTSSSDIEFKPTKIDMLFNVATSNQLPNHFSYNYDSEKNICNNDPDTNPQKTFTVNTQDSKSIKSGSNIESNYNENSLTGNFGFKPTKIAKLFNVTTSNQLSDSDLPYNYGSEQNIWNIKSDKNKKYLTEPILLSGSDDKICDFTTKGDLFNVAKSNKLSENDSSYHHDFEQSNCNTESDEYKYSLTYASRDNQLVKDIVTNHACYPAELNLQSNKTNKLWELPINGDLFNASKSNRLPVNIPSYDYNSELNICNLEPVTKHKIDDDNQINEMALDLTKCPAPTSQNNKETSWQIAEILTPINFNITSPNIMWENEDDKKIKSIMSQILPCKSFDNTQNVDPSETAANWNDFEQNLIYASQKKSKLSTFRERFCYKKSLTANKPFNSQKSQISNNLALSSINPCISHEIIVAPQHSNVAASKTNDSTFAIENLNCLPKEVNYMKKINKENTPPKSLKSLFAAAQAAKNSQK